MGKVKSAIITAFFVAAVIVLALFATVSCEVPFSNGVKRYNSFITSIRMSSELTGDAYALLYPEGVISAADYDFVVGDEEGDEKEKEEYQDTYVARGSVYVDREQLGDDATDTRTGSKEEDFLESIQRDAAILSARYGAKGYSSYSVSVEDDFVIKVTVPTGFTYAEYKSYDLTSRSNRLSAVSATMTYLTYSGELSIRNDSTYSSSQSIIAIKEDINSFFKGASYYAVGGNYAIKLELSDYGFEKLNDALAAGDSESSAYFFIGETSLGLTLTMGSTLEDKIMYFSANEETARDMSIVLDSVVSGNAIENEYNADGINSTDLIAVTSSFGEHAVVYLGVGVLIILVAFVVASVIRYKKLGLVNVLILLMYTLTVITAMMLLDVELSIAGIFTAVLGLVLLSFTNFFVFEAVRKETLLGRTLQASVKTAYKKTLSTVLDMHIILVIASAMVTLIAIGEVSACGLIFFIASLASYALYWFTRFMWYVISSPVRDKFAFCGFKREVDDDEN